jgi:L-rhamnose mutarotase
MQRGCFTLQIKKDRTQEYLAAHQVWPEMVQAMHDSGIRNYSMFLTKDGMAIGYLEADNVEEALRRCGQTDVSRRWQQYMAEFIESRDDQMPELYYYLP